MSQSYSHHRLSAESPVNFEDQDGDSDLDLAELDPPQSSSRDSYQQPNKSIALGDLRQYGRRKYARALGGDNTVGDDDMEALVENGESTGAGPKLTIPNSSLTSSLSMAKLKGLKDRLQPGKRVRILTPTQETEAENIDEEHDSTYDRMVRVGRRQDVWFANNVVSNAKYTPWSFVPRTLYHEFSYFLNMYFLIIALSQFIPALKIGLLSAYWIPLGLVIFVTLSKEAYDDIIRRRRDVEANSELFTVLQLDSDRPTVTHRLMRKRKTTISEYDSEAAVKDVDLTDHDLISRKKMFKPARDIKVGDILVMEKNTRFPADVIILKSFSIENEKSQSNASKVPNATKPFSDADLIETNAKNDRIEGQLVNETTSSDPSAGGEAFIRTDQLDGETDWKLRLAVPFSQNMSLLDYSRLQIVSGKPDRKVNEFAGTIELLPKTQSQYDPHPNPSDQDQTVPVVEDKIKAQPLSIDNTAWANTVLASSSTVLAAVIYTGPQTKAAMSTSASRSKTGLLETELNSLTKILCILTFSLSFSLVAIQKFHPVDEMKWYVAIVRFLILFSSIIPIALRVNLDLGKSWYAYWIHRDNGIPGTQVRTSTIPEDLGRIEYLLSDKTGTLTQNDMDLKKVHVGTVSYANEAMEEVSSYVSSAFTMTGPASSTETLQLYNPSTRIQNALSMGTRSKREIGSRVFDLVLALALCHNVTPTTDDIGGATVTSYQASSPDEIAIVKWTESVGLRVSHRDRKTITLQETGSGRAVVKVTILNIFPFTSESKRMGIVVQFQTNTEEIGDIVFFEKGADTVMSSIVAANDWLDEETDNMAREGLRTLVIGRRSLSTQQYAEFTAEHHEASLNMAGRDAAMHRVVKIHLEHDLELLGVTGVEDKLQAQIKPSLELLRNAGIKIWMLTGDKVETARCVAISSKLVSRGQYIHMICKLKRREAALDALSSLASRPSACLLIDGQSLSIYLAHHQDAFIALAVTLPTVIACRCSPTQKAQLALLIRSYTGKRTLCIGDGGNDVSMIQAADVGVGIVGKEGRQASLAADFSILQFAYLTKLLVWHGRNSYKRSAKLAQFIVHRGLLSAMCQLVFSIAFHFKPYPLYRDWLLIGYVTVYTMGPVFWPFVLDHDVDEDLANLYPELYKELTLGRSLSYRTFFVWLAISVYQGLIIQGGSQILVPNYYASLPDPSLPDKDVTGFKRMVSLSFTSIVLNEWIMVASEVMVWHPGGIFVILLTVVIYFSSLPALGDYFDRAWLLTGGFWWRLVAILAVSLVPVWGGKCIRRKVKPPSYRKVQGL